MPPTTHDLKEIHHSFIKSDLDTLVRTDALRLQYRVYRRSNAQQLAGIERRH
jgi:hypothetical protein